MPMNVASLITTQPQSLLRPIVCQILGEEAIPTGDLTATKIGRSVGHNTAGIFRVTGCAEVGTATTTWSAVVKVLGEPENSSLLETYDLRGEIEVYRSQVFAGVCGGLRAARCYAIQPRDEAQLLWLEDLSHTPRPPWETKHFVATARHIGQFNAHWPEETLPKWPWLERRGIRRQLTGSPPFQAAIKGLPARQNNPLMRRFASPAAVQQLARLWDTCDRLLQKAERTAKGVCHQDCHPKNLFPIYDAGMASHTVGIDWDRVGIANLGIDIGKILASPITWLEVSPDEAAALRDPIFDAYLRGLADSGWRGNERSVRLTYLTRLAFESIQHSLFISHAIDDANQAALMERLVDLPMAEIAARYRQARKFCLDCMEEALHLAQLF